MVRVRLAGRTTGMAARKLRSVFIPVSTVPCWRMSVFRFQSFPFNVENFHIYLFIQAKQPRQALLERRARKSIARCVRVLMTGQSRRGIGHHIDQKIHHRAHMAEARQISAC